MNTYNFIENENLSRNYVAKNFFEAVGFKNVKLSAKPYTGKRTVHTVEDKETGELTDVVEFVKDERFENCVFLHIHGVRPEDGRILDYDLWPRADMTAAEIAAIEGKDLVGAEISIGVYTNPETKEHIPANEPKVYKFTFADGTVINLRDGRDARPYMGA